MHVFVVGMPGEGNLGDDLISALLVRHVQARWPDATIGVLHGACPNQFSYPGTEGLELIEKPIRSVWRSYRRRWQRVRKFAERTHLLLIGGGGLFQDAWSPFTVHRWMKYAFLRESRTAEAWAVGVGFGIFRTAFARSYTRYALRRFKVVQVRDARSLRVARGLLGRGAQPRLLPSLDVVLGSDLSWTPFRRVQGNTSMALGCSILPWPGLQYEQVLQLLEAVCIDFRQEAWFFVFNSIGKEYDYVQKLVRSLRARAVHCRIFCYGRDPLDEFAQAFCSVAQAVAARYHANILWQLLSVPVVPIAYYPKVDCFYSERGGFALPLNDLLVRPHRDAFQQIRLEGKYELPPVLPGQDGHVSWLGSAASRTVSALESIYEAGRYFRNLKSAS